MTEEQFTTAAEEVKDLAQTPSNEEKLDLYKYYKQATKGDVTGTRPGLFSFEARAKWDAWASIKGTDTDEARSSYIKLVAVLKEKYN